MQLFYTPDIVSPDYILPQQESLHAVRVMRLREGDMLSLTDGRGNLFRARIVSAAKECRVHVEERVEEFEKRSYGLTLAVAPTKNMDRFEWFLEKATEAGIDRIVPIVCEHSERRTINAERCEKVIVSAMKQSLKAYKPTLEPLTDLRKLLAAPEAYAPAEHVAASTSVTRLIAHCESGFDRRFIGDCLSRGCDTLVLIGPEGDFSPAEIKTAYDNGFAGISLGESRYRTESAAVAVAMIAAFVNGR